MPNELYIYEGFITDGTGVITGSLNVGGGVTGSLFGTSSRAVTASFAESSAVSVKLSATNVSSGIYSIPLMDDQGNIYKQPTSLQYNAASGTLSTNVASASNVVFGAYNELAPYEFGYSIVITPYGADGTLESPNELFYDPTTRTITVTSSFATTASFVRNAVTASYVLNAVSASFASTASFVNTLNQNVLITGSLTVGSSSLGTIENTLTLGPPIGGTSVEGGQIGFQAAPSSTSASFIDQYQDGPGPMIRILKGTNAGSQIEVAKWNIHTRQMILPGYTATNSYAGTVAGLLAFDSSGNILTTTASTGGGGGGSGTVNSGVAGYLAYYPSTGTTVDDTSGLFWDAATSRLGIGTATPNSGALHVSGGVFATSFTGSLLGTATTASFSSTASFVNTLDQNVVITGSLGIAQTTPTSRLHINANQNSVTQNDANGILLANATAATANTQSISPGIVLQGNGWKTNTTAGSQDVRFRIDVLPVQGAANPTATLQIAASVNGAAYTNRLIVTSGGAVQATGAGFYTDGIITSALQIFSVGNQSAGQQLYRTTNGGSNVIPRFAAGESPGTAGTKQYAIDSTNGIMFIAANGSNRIVRAAIDIINLVNTPVSESADLAIRTQSGGTATTTKMLISGSGNVSILSGSLGVGTLNPNSASLHVNGNIFATAITASFINSGTDLIDLSSPSGITISTTGSGFVNINTGLTGTVRISSPLIVTGSILSLDNITAYSDESVKSNVSTIPNALNKVLEMRGVTYTRTDLQDTERIHAGVIAQELERQFPEVVYELPNGKKTVAYGNITSILIEAIKEQQKQIDDLRKQIEKLT